MKAYRFETDCIRSDGDSINDMRASPTEITYSTMLRHCEGLIEWAVDHGYVRQVNQDHGLTLRNDWHVGYYKSTYRGKPCYYLVWSGIEQVWVKAA